MCDAAMLKRLRRGKRLSQQQVADYLHMDRSTYSYYELGQTKPTIDFLIKLAHLYGLHLNDLLGELPPEEPRERSNMLFGQLDREEQRLVVLYRAGNPVQRRALLAQTEAPAEES